MALIPKHSSSKKAKGNRRRNGSDRTTTTRTRRTDLLYRRNKGDENLLVSFHVPDRCAKLARRLHKCTPVGLSTLLALSMATFVVWLSRFDCFHLHVGYNGNLHDMEFKHVETKVDGYLDFHFKATTKMIVSEGAQDLLDHHHPNVNLEDLDLEIILTKDEFGANPLCMAETNYHGRNHHPDCQSRETSIGKPPEEPVVHVTRAMVRRALQKQVAAMPKPSEPPRRSTPAVSWQQQHHPR